MCQFFGLLSTKELHFILMEFGSRGSLNEVLSNWNTSLNLTIKMSLLHDLVRVSEKINYRFDSVHNMHEISYFYAWT